MAGFPTLLPLVLDDFFEEGEAEDRLCGFRIFFFDFVGETGFGVRGRETDQRFEGTGCHGGGLALVAFELVIAEGGVGCYDVVCRSFCEDGFTL